MDRQTRQQQLARWAVRFSGQGALESLDTREAPALGWIERATARDEEKDHARSAVRKLSRGEMSALEPTEMSAFEAIVLPEGRPVLDVVRGSFARPPSPWEHLDLAEARQKIEAAIPCVGRVEVPRHPQLPYAGTGFIVGEGLLMTNRHVAELFSTGLGTRDLVFRPGLEPVNVDFGREVEPAPPAPLRLREVLIIHPYWDMALLRVEGLTSQTRLVLQAIDPKDLQGRDVVVVGYPAQDPRNDYALQNRIFRGIFQVKRMQPGKLGPRRDADSFGNRVSALTHDSSTLGGNSGSAIIDAQTGQVVGLHFGGVYLDTNYGVPAFEMKSERRLRDAGVCFSDDPVPDDPSWARVWQSVERPKAIGSKESRVLLAPQSPPAVPAPLHVRTGDEAVASISLMVPLHVTVSLGAPETTPRARSNGAAVADGGGVGVAISAVGTTVIDSDSEGR